MCSEERIRRDGMDDGNEDMQEMRLTCKIVLFTFRGRMKLIWEFNVNTMNLSSICVGCCRMCGWRAREARGERRGGWRKWTEEEVLWFDGMTVARWNKMYYLNGFAPRFFHPSAHVAIAHESASVATRMWAEAELVDDATRDPLYLIFSFHIFPFSSSLSPLSVLFSNQNEEQTNDACCVLSIEANWFESIFIVIRMNEEYRNI